MERIEIGKEIIQDVINNNKIGAIKKLRKKFPFSIAYKIATELKIIIQTEQIQEINDEIIDRLNEELNQEKNRLLAPIGTSI